MLKNFLQLLLEICHAQINSKQHLLLDLRKISYGSAVRRTYVRTKVRKSGTFIIKNMLKNFLQLLLEICYAQLNSKWRLLLDLRKISYGSAVRRTYVRTIRRTFHKIRPVSDNIQSNGLIMRRSNAPIERAEAFERFKEGSIRVVKFCQISNFACNFFLRKLIT